jgi:hypothetical protein
VFENINENTMIMSEQIENFRRTMEIYFLKEPNGSSRTVKTEMKISGDKPDRD